MDRIVHGGDRRAAALRYGLPAEAFLDFSASVSPLGVPGSAAEAIRSAIPALVHYPDPVSGELAGALADRHARAPGEILVTNGSTEALTLAFRALSPGRVGIVGPGYRDAERAARQVSAAVDFHLLEAARGFAADPEAVARWAAALPLVYWGTPNNPTGRAVPAGDLRRVADACPGTRFLLDESFLEFVGGARSMAEGPLAPNVLVMRSFTKFYALAGLRLGYLVAPAALVEALRAQGEPWSVNALAQAAGLACLGDAAYAEATRRLVAAERAFLEGRLKALGLVVFPSEANFLLVRSPGAAALADRLGRRGLLVRDASDFPGLGPGYLRLAVRTRQENLRLLEAMGREASA